MKLIKEDKGNYRFEIEAKEKALLFKILRLYPVIPAAHQRLSKSEDRPEDQKLLDAALAEQRAHNKKQLLVMMRSRLRKGKTNWRFTVSAAQVEWLLQALNDIRVGSWLALGSPDGPVEILAALNDKTAPDFWAMEVSGHFQAVLLAAVRGN